MKTFNTEQLNAIPLTELARGLNIQQVGDNGNFQCFSAEHNNQEEKPSLSIKDGKGFHCHKKCGATGKGAISFYQQYTNCEFQEACEKLSAMYNIPTIEGKVIRQKSPKYKDLLKYKKYLQHSEQFNKQDTALAKRAAKELKSRGISLAVAQKYKIAVIENFFISQIKKYNDQNKTDTKTNYDVIAFPIYSESFEYIGLKYRLFANDYKQLPKEVGLAKSMTLSGSKTGLLFDLKIIQEANEIILTEGEIDGLSLASLGFENVVINLGGVGNCMKTIKSLCLDKKVISLYDNDKTGKEANHKLVEALKRPVYTIELPCAEGKEKTDVNDKINEGWGKEKFIEAMAHTTLLGAENKSINNPSEFLKYLKQQATVKHVYSSGIIEEKYYHLVYCPDPFIIFSDRSFVQLQEGNTFTYQKIKYQLKQSPIPKKLLSSINSISKEGVVKFIEESTSIEKKAIFSTLTNTLNLYYEFYDNKESEVISCHIIHSYLLNLFGKTVYLLLLGERATGKSSLQVLMSKLQFNGCFSGKSTVPVTVRKVHCFQVALNLDELEKVSQDDKKTITGVFNTGYIKGGTYEVTDMTQQKDSDQIKSFHTFGTKTFSVNSIKGFDDSLISRCFTINTVKNTKRIQDIMSLTLKEEESFQNIRNATFIYCMTHWKEIQNSFKEAKSFFESKNIMGRSADTLAILGGIHFHFNEDKEFFNYLMTHDEFNEDDKKNLRLEIILDYLEEKLENYTCQEGSSSEVEFSNEELVNEVNEKLDPNDEFKATANSIAILLKSHRIIDSIHARKGRISSGNNKGKTQYFVQYKHLVSILERQGRCKNSEPD